MLERKNIYINTHKKALSNAHVQLSLPVNSVLPAQAIITILMETKLTELQCESRKLTLQRRLELEQPI